FAPHQPLRDVWLVPLQFPGPMRALRARGAWRARRAALARSVRSQTRRNPRSRERRRAGECREPNRARVASRAEARERARLDSLGREAALLQQRFDIRIAATELPVRLGAVRRVARREDVLAQLVRRRLVEQVLRLDKRFAR